MQDSSEKRNGYGLTTEWLTSAEAAKYLKIDRRTLLHYARQGKVRARHHQFSPKIHFWPTLLIGLLLIKAFVLSVVKSNPTLALLGRCAYFLLLLIATAFALQNAASRSQP